MHPTGMRMSYLLSLCTIGGFATLLGFRATAAEAPLLPVKSELVSMDEASSAFRFQRVPSPAGNDAAEQGALAIIDGAADPASGGLERLNDGRLPGEADAPQANFFFSAGSQGGRVLIDLGKLTPISCIRTYSWHPDWRAPQHYDVFTASGNEPGFDPKPAKPNDPAQSGWRLTARVDAGITNTDPGGQWAVQVGASSGTNVVCRYLLLDVMPTRSGDRFAQTFFSEIDVIASGTKLEPIAQATPMQEFKTAGGETVIALDTSETPDLADWARTNMIPMAVQWYPRIVQMLSSEGFQPPRRVQIVIRENASALAAASGNRIQCSAKWFRQNLHGEAQGAVFHELVHVVQQYRGGRDRSSAPGWLTEGIADYMRWFVFQPEAKGAEITARNIERARYDASYRVTANFLNWVTEKYARDLVPKLNAASRQGRYSPELWVQITGKSVGDLGAEWKEAMASKIKASKAAAN